MIAVIDGCGSNINSVLFAIKRLGFNAILTTDHPIIQQASHVILPGVGTAAHAMQQLNAQRLPELIKKLTQPVLGICLGMQLLFDSSAEGNIPCLHIIPGKVTALPQRPDITIPHMGWNKLQINKPNSPLLTGIPQDSYFYFVHSFAAPINEFTQAGCTHGRDFAAVIARDNFFATQFHPERSGTVGAQLLENFLNL